jgi:tetratricopeptide (TPR) repeat protein
MAIDQAEPLIKQQDVVKNLRMKTCFRHARDLHDQGKYTEALSRGKQALALEPNNTVLQRFILEVEALVPEESYMRLIHEAEQALEKQDFTQALQQLAGIPADSRLIEQVQKLRQQARQAAAEAEEKARQAAAEAEANASPEQLRQREERLRRLLEPGDATVNRPKVREDLSKVLARRASEELKQFDLVHKQNPKLGHSRLVYAQGQAEEALEFDPRNVVAQQLLEKLKELLAPKKEEKKGGKA